MMTFECEREAKWLKPDSGLFSSWDAPLLPHAAGLTRQKQRNLPVVGVVSAWISAPVVTSPQSVSSFSSWNVEVEL